MISPPVETVFGPIVITPTGPWLVLELETVSYEAETPDVKGQLVAQLAGWAAVAESDFQILRVSREWNGAEYVENLRRHMPRRAHRDLYRELLNRQQQVLEAMAATTSVVFLCVRLADPATDLHQKARGLFDQSPRELAARAREALRMTQLGSLEPARLSELYRRAAAAWDLAYQWLQCQPARTDQIQWLIYRNFCRSLGEPFIPGLDQPQAVTAAYRFEPTVVPEKGNVLRWLLEHGVERHPRHLKVTSELGDSYQAGLCVGEIKQDAELFTPAAELMFSALDLPFRVDASLSLKYVQNEVALRRWERVIAKSREQTREEEEQTGGDAKTASVRRVGLAHEAHEELAKSGAPHLEGTLSLLIGAPSAEELRKRVEHARRAFPWPLHRPHGDQLELWLSHFPGQHFRPVGYQRVWMCDQVGAMVPQAARQAGARTPSGLYFAHSLRGRHPILMDLREGSDSAKSTLIVLLGSPGGGKALADDTPIPTPLGWRPLSELAVGDQVFDECGQPCNVTGVYPQPSGRDCYEVGFSDGASVIADAEHRWETIDRDARQIQARTRCLTRRVARRELTASRYRGVKPDGDRWLAYHGNLRHIPLGHFENEIDAARAAAAYRVRENEVAGRGGPRVHTTEEIRDSLYRGDHLNHAVPVAGPLQYPERELPLAPYTLGAWLGDGSSAHSEIWTADPEVVENIRCDGYTVKKQARPLQYSLHLCENNPMGRPGVRAVLKRLGVLNNKHIPDGYLHSSEQQRRALLAGLLDTDGTVSPHGQVHYDSTSKDLADGALELARSLGYRATMIRKRATLYGRDCGPVYRVRFTTSDDVFRLERKRKSLRERTAVRHRPELVRYRYITDVRPVASRPVRCISVDSQSHLYLCGREMIPTHNTMTLQYLEYLGFVLGARVVDIEAKDDHRAHLLPAVLGHTQEIVIGPGPEHRGKLDPLRVAPFGERQEAGTTFLCDLLPKAQSDRLETVVNGAVSRVIRQAGERQAPELACCTEVVRMLHESGNELEREAGYHLSQYRDGGLAQLGFADLKTPLPQASEQWTYINVKALKRAAIATVRSEMTTGERHSRAILQLIALYAMRILDEEPDRLKVLGFDEASFISADAVGEQLINQLSRWGRSKLALPILSTQLSRDVEQEEGLVGQALLFGMRQEAEARAALKLAELDPDDHVLIQNLLTGYGAGRALYRDLHDRHEEIQVDVVDRDLFRGLRTDPAREETFDDFERDAWAA